MRRHTLKFSEFVLLCAFGLLIAAKYGEWLLGFLP